MAKEEKSIHAPAGKRSVLSDAIFRSVIENISEVIYEVDGNGIFTYVNSAIEKLTGFTPGEGSRFPFTLRKDWMALE